MTQKEHKALFVYPSNNFLFKNQLATEEPKTVVTEFIPPLAPIWAYLSKRTEYCSVRALCSYVDNTKALRDNNKFAFYNSRIISVRIYVSQLFFLDQ